MADGDNKTPPGSPPIPLPKKEDSNANRRSQSSAGYSEGPNIATLFSQPQKRPHDHQNQQAFYTGGSEHSGQQVLGPRNDAQHQEAKKIFKRMVKMMRRQHEEEDEGDSSSHFAPFTGSGFTLGTEEADSERVDGPNITPIDKSESEANSQYPAFVGSGFTLGTTENDSQLVKGIDEEEGAEEEDDEEEEDDGSSPMCSFSGRGFILGTADNNSQSVEDETKNVSENSAAATVEAEDDDEDNDGEDSPVYERPFPGTGFTLGATESDSKPIPGDPVPASDDTTLSYFEQFSRYLGPGFTLGTNENDSQRVDAPSTSKGAGSNKVPLSVLRFWSNGISIDNGPLRSFNDPLTMQLFVNFHQTMKTYRIENHRNEEYKQILKTFAGEGNRLKDAKTASKEPTIINTTNTPSTSSSSDPVLNRGKALSAGLSFLSFDQSQPGTRIQIRLANGSRIVTQINTSRLVSDLRQYIIIAHPEYSETEFQLMSTFPNKIIDQENVTIEQSGLANSTLVQHLI